MSADNIVWKTATLTALALLAFAGNSVLCRLALSQGLIDAPGFTTIRLLSGALALLALLFLRKSTTQKQTSQPAIKHLFSASALFIYALFFAIAYVQLDTGAGALVLFGAVQISLLVATFCDGKTPRIQELLGVVIAFTGLTYLLAPAWGSPTLLGFCMMLIAGVAWGIYTWKGSSSKNPMLDTTLAFMGCLPLLIILNLFWFDPYTWTLKGAFLAIFSGVITSALGYALWYSILPKLSAMQAGVVQLLVPVLAVLGGAIVVNESITQRLMVSLILVITGISMTLLVKRKAA